MSKPTMMAIKLAEAGNPGLPSPVVDPEETEAADPEGVGELWVEIVGEGIGVALTPGDFTSAKSVARAAATAEMVASAAERCSDGNAAVGWPVGIVRMKSTIDWLANSGKAGITPRGSRICFIISSSVNLV